MRKNVKAVVTMFVTTAVILALVLGLSLYMRAEGEHDNCVAINSVRSALSDILTRSETLALKNREYTPLEKEVAVMFYNRALRDLKPTSC